MKVSSTQFSNDAKSIKAWENHKAKMQDIYKEKNLHHHPKELKHGYPSEGYEKKITWTKFDQMLEDKLWES